MSIHTFAKIFLQKQKFATFLKSLIVAAILISPSSNLKSQLKKDKPGIFYLITGNGLKDTSYLFGTYHLVNNSYLNEMPEVEKSFKKAKGRIVEVVIDSSKLSEVQSMSMMKEKKLSQLLDKPFSDSLEKELQSALGIGLAQADQLKPMALTLTLSIIYLMKNNNEILQLYKGVPLDVYFVNEAKAGNKNISPFETMDEQMNMLLTESPLKNK